MVSILLGFYARYPKFVWSLRFDEHLYWYSRVVTVYFCEPNMPKLALCYLLVSIVNRLIMLWNGCNLFLGLHNSWARYSPPWNYKLPKQTYRSRGISYRSTLSRIPWIRRLAPFCNTNSKYHVTCVFAWNQNLPEIKFQILKWTSWNSYLS